MIFKVASIALSFWPKIGLSFFEGGLEFFENGQENTLKTELKTVSFLGSILFEATWAFGKMRVLKLW